MDLTRRGFLGVSVAGAVGALTARSWFDMGASWTRSEMGLWIPVREFDGSVSQVFLRASSLVLRDAFVPVVEGNVFIRAERDVRSVLVLTPDKNLSVVVPMAQAKALWRGGAERSKAQMARGRVVLA